MQRSLFGASKQVTVAKVHTENTVNLPDILEKVEDVNAFIEALGSNAQYLDQQEITCLYNQWTAAEQKKFIWENGIKPNLNEKLRPGK